MKAPLVTTLFFTMCATAGFGHEAPRTASEIEAYIQTNLKFLEVQATRIDTYSDKNVPAVRFAIKNNGDETLTRITVNVYFLDKQGKRFYEETYFPVSDSAYSFNRGSPLKPNYTYRMEASKWMVAKSLGEEWGGEIEIEFGEVEFAE